MLLKIHDRKVIFFPAFLGGLREILEKSTIGSAWLCLYPSFLHSLARNNVCSFLYFSPEVLLFVCFFFFFSALLTPLPQKRERKAVVLEIEERNRERENLLLSRIRCTISTLLNLVLIILTKFVLTRSYKLVTVVILWVVSCLNQSFSSAEWKTIFSFPWLKFGEITS